VRQHLRDRHLASWRHFSRHLTRREEHIHEIESLLVRIAKPKGNRVVPHGKSAGALLKQLKARIQQQQKNELAELLSSREPTRRSPQTNASKHPNTLVGLVDKRVPIFRTYKGKEYKAFLDPKGIITLGGEKYSLLTGAARSLLETPRAVNDAGGILVYPRCAR
jgi:hypothetical protein